VGGTTTVQIREYANKQIQKTTKTMKNTSIILITAVSLLGCRTVKDHSEAYQRYETIEKRQSTLQWNQYDSTGLYWHFQSDSPFYYHPQSGLYGWGGRLIVGEKRVQHRLWQLHDDSAGYRMDEQSNESYSSTSAAFSSGWRLRVITAAVILVLIFLYVGRLYKI